MSVTLTACLLLTFLAAAGRLTVPTRPFAQFGWPLTYEALAHLLAGFLLGAWCMGGGWPYLALFAALTAWEIGCFLLLR